MRVHIFAATGVELPKLQLPNCYACWEVPDWCTWLRRLGVCDCHHKSAVTWSSRINFLKLGPAEHALDISSSIVKLSNNINMYHRMSGIIEASFCVNNMVMRNGDDVAKSRSTLMRRVNVWLLCASRFHPATIIILCSNSPLLNHIAKSTQSTSSLKICRYKKKPGCVLVAANTAAQIITFR